MYERSVYRSTDSDSKNEGSWKEVGQVARDGLHHFEPVVTDAEAIRVEGEGVVPQGIFGWGGDLIPTKPAGRVRKGNVVCFSGARSQVPSCGPVVALDALDLRTRRIFNQPALLGDSGGPVWAAGSSASIGLITASRANGSETLVEPLLHPSNLPSNQIVGILNNKYMAPLSLKLGE